MTDATQTAGTPVREDSAVFQQYAVLWLDVLGQSKSLKHLDEITCDEQMAGKDLRAAIRQTAGRVEFVRRVLTRWFENYHATPPLVPIAQLQPDLRRMFNRFRRRILDRRMFGDTIIAFAPLGDPYGYCRTRELFALIGAACSTMICCLGEGIAIRGGLDVGFALDMRDGDPYGPVWMRAYELENEVAVSPRVVVGDGAMAFLSQAMAVPDDADVLAKIYRDLARVCKNTITTNKGVLYIDYLGKAAKEFTRVEGFSEAAQKGLDFARAEEIRNAGNPKVAAKYTSLRKYYEARQSEWQ